ncbi:hypothetical protein A2303_03645 [Candidatus Falkowbacteria bacterium RIFOXYB2_FULL_47_14]|uniref:Uncharacterized protein n=1 Tax=Candidatus Falkowbacteria bacterium RIFOXYA2_FULL_47_19 TaxID=1797994 RepID=A0A1F5SHU4_9BACT|nr:MAG: hypothetical protein A2227_03190 [Candidatus Falkowbacteria bacterium RIFOXYA2_FULL_47_19]OGF34658.1 MAG: hypothetical protein A2468_07425 [Candidatus Falkowbacteria bacterium RIFOXYC2_FULL_46_15]OGF42492.1 MAG: hypothetical protein A2303_03645 [Candidatus Falkowbacteria bacterium RIFOXYB2_FULL_47_14]
MVFIGKKIKPNSIPSILAKKFRGRKMITCYLGSNAATPTASLKALAAAAKERRPKLPFIRLVHTLLQGPAPHTEPGLEDRIMSYSIFSGENIRRAANEGRAFYLPCTLRNIENIIAPGEEYCPDVAIFKVRRHPQTGEYSLGLSVEALHAAIDHAKVVIAEEDDSMPFVLGQSVVDADSIDYLVTEGVEPVYSFPAPDFDNLGAAEKRIGEQIVSHFIRDGVTLQVGIGKITDAAIGMIKNAGFRNLGVQTELYGDGLMLLQKLNIINNRRKKANMGYSTTCLIMGTRELYDFTHLRNGVQMRPASYTNAVETIRRNAPFISINTAIGVDLFGNVWADFIDPRRYWSGIGGQPDFIRALSSRNFGTPIIAIKSLAGNGESKIVLAAPPGISQTAAAYDGVVIVNEFGVADLRGLTTGNKALAIASIAHPKFREGLIRHIYDDPFFTKPQGYTFGKTPKGVIMYEGNIPL